MSLKLFRSTGYSSIVSPGETRVAMHPGWMILAVSMWVGFVCNVALWRQLSAFPADGAGLLRTLVLGAFVAAGVGVFLSILGWRKTLKPAATLALLLAALAATSIWGQALPVDATLFEKRPSSLFLPSWASLLRWQISLLLVGLALVPMVWVWHANVRRLPGPAQLTVNMLGIVLSAMILAATGFMLFRGPGPGG